MLFLLLLLFLHGFRRHFLFLAILFWFVADLYSKSLNLIKELCTLYYYTCFRQLLWYLLSNIYNGIRYLFWRKRKENENKKTI